MQIEVESMLDDELVSATVLGEWLGCSARTIREYTTQGIITKAGKSGYALKASVSAVTEHFRSLAAGWTAESSDGAETLSPAAESAQLNRARRALTEQQTRKATVQAQIAETELQVVMGKLLDITEVSAAWGLIITVAKQRFLGLSARLPTVIHGLNREEIAIIASEVRDILDQLSHDGEQVVSDVTVAAARKIAKAQTKPTKESADGETDQ